jgi:tetratricopeptide (TPR) repeat protein
MKILPAILCLLMICGCAGTSAPRAAVQGGAGTRSAPTTAQVQASLALQEIQPVPQLAQLKQSAATLPTSRPSLEAIELFARARGAHLDRNVNTAVSLLERAIEADPTGFAPRYALGKEYAAMGNRAESAIKAYEAAARIDPDHLELQVELGREYLGRQDADNAIRHLRLALQTRDYAEEDEHAALADFFLARALQQRGYDRAALDQYDRLLKRLQRPTLAMRSNPEVASMASHPDAIYADVAALYEKHGQHQLALDAFSVVAQRNPDDFEVQARLVQMLLALGRNQDAVNKSEAIVAQFRASPESLSLLRSTFTKAGRQGAIIDELSRLHREHPHDRSMLFALADSLEQLGQRQRADAVLAEALQKQPSAVEIVRKQVSLHKARNDTPGAAAVLIEYLARQPDALTELSSEWDSLLRGARRNSIRPSALQELDVSPSAAACKLYWVSRIASLWSRDALARSAIEQAVLLDPPFPPAFRAQMNQIYGRSDWDDAKKQSAADALIASARSRGAAALAEELRGMSFFAQGKHADAVKALGEAMKLGDTSPDLHLTYAQALRDGGDGQKYEQILWKLLSDRPGYEDAYASLFRYYLVNNAPAPARKVLDTWLSAQPDSVPARLLQATIVLRNGNQPEAAEQLLLDLFHQSPDDPEVLAALHAFYQSVNRIPQLLEKLEVQRAQSPDNRAVVEQLVDLYASQKRPADAIRVLDSARTAAGQDPDLLYYLAHLYERVDQKSTTEKILQQIVQIDPHHASANNDLGYSWAEQGKNLSRAEEMIRIALNQEPDNESFLDSLGWVLYKRGKFAEARKYLDQAVAPASFPDPVVLDHLGDTLYRLRDTAAAKSNWQRAMQRLSVLTEAGAQRDDLAQLKLALQQKLKLLEQNQPATVAPTASPEQNPAQAIN